MSLVGPWLVPGYVSLFKICSRCLGDSYVYSDWSIERPGTNQGLTRDMVDSGYFAIDVPGSFEPLVSWYPLAPMEVQ